MQQKERGRSRFDWVTPRLAAAVAALALAGPALASQPSVEERLERLEASYRRLAAENADLRRLLEQRTAAANPGGASPVATSAVAAATTAAPQVESAAGTERTLTVGGVMQVQGEFGGAAEPRYADVNDRFYFRRARIYLAGQLGEHFDFKIETDLGGNSTRDSSGLRASGNDIYLTWKRYGWASIRAGQQKTAWGGDQLGSDISTFTMERYLGSDQLTDSRQLGLALFGGPHDERWGYLFTVTNGSGKNSSANDNNQFHTALRVHGTLLDLDRAGQVSAGLDAMRSQDSGISRQGFGFDSVPDGTIDDLFAGERSGWGFDLQWKIGNFDFMSEYLRERFEPVNDLPAPVLNADGWHLTGGYWLLSQRLQAVISRQWFDPDRDVAGDATAVWIAGANFWYTPAIKLQVNVERGDSPGLPDDSTRVLARVQAVY